MPLSADTQVLQEGPTGPGKRFGATSADPIAFFGATPIVQPSLGGASAIGASVAVGSIATMATSQSPTSVDAQTTVERTLTPYVGTNAGTGMTWQIAAGDFLMVNKPTSQAGLGIGNVRRIAASVGVTFNNWTAATVTPTAGQAYGIVAIRGLTTLTAVLTPVSVAANTTAEQTFTVTGVSATGVISVSKPTAQTTLDIVGYRAISANTIGITFGNTSPSTPVVPTAGETYTVFQTPGIAGVSNVVLIEANIGASGGPTGTAVSALGVTVTGLAATDAIMGVSKPTIQAGAALLGGFVSGANVLGVSFVELAATVTPTAGEVYAVTINRPNPAAPCVIYSSTQTPAGVAADTTAEQTFTVTGIVAGSVVIVNKPTAQAGLGIVGARVSGTDTIAVTFCNATAAVITPTAGEAYRIANFQQAIPDSGNAFVFSVNPGQYSNTTLVNAVQTALLSLGLVAA